MTFITKTWSTPANVMITASGSDLQQITGPVRDKLFVKLTGSGSTPGNNTSVTMSVANVSTSWSNWLNGQTVTINNLASNTSIQFSYTSSYGYWNTTYAGSTTAQNLVNGTVTINFRRQ